MYIVHFESNLWEKNDIYLDEANVVGLLTEALLPTLANLQFYFPETLFPR